MSEATETATPVKIQAQCSLCEYSKEMQMAPTDLRRVWVCKRFPPVPVAIPQRTGINISAMHPPVEPTSFCYEFKHSPAKMIAANDSGN